MTPMTTQSRAQRLAATAIDPKIGAWLVVALAGNTAIAFGVDDQRTAYAAAICWSFVAILVPAIAFAIANRSEYRLKVDPPQQLIPDEFVDIYDHDATVAASYDAVLHGPGSRKLPMIPKPQKFVPVSRVPQFRGAARMHPKDARRLQALAQSGTPVFGRVRRKTSRHYIVDIGRTAFMPREAARRSATSATQLRSAALVSFLIIKVDVSRNRVVVIPAEIIKRGSDEEVEAVSRARRREARRKHTS